MKTNIIDTRRQFYQANRASVASTIGVRDLPLSPVVRREDYLAGVDEPQVGWYIPISEAEYNALVPEEHRKQLLVQSDFDDE